MPNLVVYVPQKLWDRLHKLGLDDPRIDARMVSIGAIEKLVNGHLPERGGAKPVPGSVTEPGSRRDTDAGLADLAARSLDVPRSGSCPMQPARGTKCKACGKVHPL